MVKHFEMTQERPNLNSDDRIVHILVCSVHAHANTEPHMCCANKHDSAAYLRCKMPNQTHSGAICGNDKVERGQLSAL